MLPDYLRVDDIRAQLEELGHKVSEREVEQLLLDLGFGDAPSTADAAAAAVAAAPAARVVDTEAMTAVDSSEYAFSNGQLEAMQAQLSQVELKATSPSKTAAGRVAFTKGVAANVTRSTAATPATKESADGFEWKAVSNARPSLGRLLSTETTSQPTQPMPSRASTTRSTAAPAAAAVAAPAPHASTTAARLSWPASLSRSSASTQPRRMPAAPVAAAESLQDLYRSLHEAAADMAAGPATSTRSSAAQEAGQPGKSQKSAQGSPRSVGAPSTSSSRRTSASGSERSSGPGSKVAAPSKHRRSDPVSRYHELQRVWSRDRFLQNGGDSKAQRRQKDGFQAVFSALHAAEAARRS